MTQVKLQQLVNELRQIVNDDPNATDPTSQIVMDLIKAVEKKMHTSK